MDKVYNTPKDSPRSNDENQLMAFIRQYSKRIGEHQSNADLSYALMEMGTKTEFAQNLEDALFNPAGAISEIKKKVDNEVISVVDRLFRLFITKAKEDSLINAAFKTNNTNNELRYGIILKEDSHEARDSIFKFLNFYYTLDLSEQVPVHFQFVPEELKERISNKEFIT